ncbi:MAG: heparinase II/III-family protein [bacterium]|nr:heparinase II/III-family protein [bacterium]
MKNIEKHSLFYEDIQVFFSSGKNRLWITITPGGTTHIQINKKRIERSRSIKIATSIKNKSWNVEIGLSSTLLKNKPGPGSVWKFCIARSRKGTYSTWPILSGNKGYHDYGYFARLIFTDGNKPCIVGKDDKKIFVYKTNSCINIDGIIEKNWFSQSAITELAPLPINFDRRLKKIPPFEKINALIGNRYKRHAFTTIPESLIEKSKEVVKKERWANDIFSEIKETADWWALKTDDEIYKLIPEKGPFAYAACYSAGCPICGTGNAGNTTKALLTSINTPFLWKCFTCERTFGPDIEIEYKGKRFKITDDGSGWMIPEGLPNTGHKCYFVAAWRNYFLFCMLGSSRAIMLSWDDSKKIVGGLSALATVYAITGNKKYAHKALLILARVSQLHPVYDGVMDIGDVQKMPHIGWTTGGAEEIVENCIYAYDMVFDHLKQDKTLIDFLKKKAYPDFDGDGILTHFDIQKCIAVNLFGYMYEWLLRVRKESVQDDWTVWHCAHRILIGRLLENPDIIYEAIEGKSGFKKMMIERHLNDGRFIYNSLNYHFHKPVAHGKVLFAAHGYHDGIFFKKPLNLFHDENIPYESSVRYAEGIMCAGRIPGIGDAYPPRFKVGPDNDSLLIQIAWLLPIYNFLVKKIRNKKLFIEKFKKSLKVSFTKDILWIFTSVQNIRDILLKTSDYVPQRTCLFTDSGLAILRTDNDGFNQIHVLLNYGVDGTGHSHHDQLALNIIAYGYELTINKGYPYTWTLNTKVPAWIQNSASKNIVRIDGNNQTAYSLIDIPVEKCAGSLLAFVDNELVAMAEGRNEKSYPDIADLYRRSVILVKDPQNPFIVDIFNVKGGRIRDYQFHAQSDIEGKNFEIHLEDATLQKTQEPIEYIDRRFIYDISTATTYKDIIARWWIGDENNTGLLLHMLSSDGKRMVITGRGQAEGDDRPVPCDVHLAVREIGEKPSKFVSLIFPYQEKIPEYKVETLKKVPSKGQDSAIAISVTTGKNRYIIFHDIEGRKIHRFRKNGITYFFKGLFCIMLEQDGFLMQSCIASGTLCGRDKEIFKLKKPQILKVYSVDMETKSIFVKVLDSEIKPGCIIKWLNKPWAYKVKKVEPKDRMMKLYLDTFSLLDKGRYKMVNKGDKIIVLQSALWKKISKKE